MVAAVSPCHASPSRNVRLSIVTPPFTRKIIRAAAGTASVALFANTSSYSASTGGMGNSPVGSSMIVAMTASHAESSSRTYSTTLMRVVRSGKTGAPNSVVIAGLDPAIHHLRKKLVTKRMDARVISAFTRVFDALLPAHDAPSNLAPREKKSGAAH